MTEMNWMTAQVNRDLFTVCPKCGARALKPSGQYSYYCPECDFEFYMNVAAAAAALIPDTEGNLLVAVRGREPQKGTYDLPGGFMDPGETAEEAIAREIKEELNLKIICTEYFLSRPNRYLYKGVVYATIDAAFICHVEDFSCMKAMDDIDNVVRIPVPDLDVSRFGFESIRAIVQAFLDYHTRNA